MNSADSVPEGVKAITSSPTSPWQQRIDAFAKAVGKTADAITEALRPLVGDPGDEALVVLSDPQALFDEDLLTALVKEGPKIPIGVYRKNLGVLRGPPPVVAMVTDRTTSPSFDMLPNVPEDTSFLEMLKVGGVLKPGVTEVISAIRAALADKVGLYDLSDIIVKKMEEFAEEQEEAIGESFFKLREIIVSRSYGDVLSVLKVPGSFVTEGRRVKFLSKLDTDLWSELRSFDNQLNAWQEAYMKGIANPGLALSMLAMAQSGRGGMLPPGMMQAPETATLRDAAEAVVNKINKIFAGFGVPVARALAYDATRIKTVLEDPALPAALGATNREQMIKMLGVSVGADYVRLERSITRYTLAIMELPKVTSGNEEYAYLGAMLQLGSSIPWDKLPNGSGARAGIGRTSRGSL